MGSGRALSRQDNIAWMVAPRGVGSGHVLVVYPGIVSWLDSVGENGASRAAAEVTLEGFSVIAKLRESDEA